MACLLIPCSLFQYKDLTGVLIIKMRQAWDGLDFNGISHAFELIFLYWSSPCILVLPWFLNGRPHFFCASFLISFSKFWLVDCVLSMWGKIMIQMYRLWLHGLYGLYGPQCLMSPKRLLNLITHSLTPCVTMASTAMLLTVEDGHGLIYGDNDLIKQAAVFNVEKFYMIQIGVYISWYNSACKERYIHERHCDHWAE